MEFLVFPCQNDHEWNSTKYLGNLQVTIYENNIILYDFLLNKNNKGIINEIIRRHNRVSTEKITNSITKTKYKALKVI